MSAESHHIPEKERNVERKTGWALFWLLFLSYAYFFQGGGWNQNTRFDQVRAIVEQGGLSVNSYYENTGDLALKDGFFYPNKPPGISFLGVPVYFVLYHLEHWLGIDPGRINVLHGNLHAVTVFTVSLVGALAGSVFFRLLHLLRPSPPLGRAFLAAGLGLGTLVFPWSTLFQAHQVSGFLTFTAFAMLVAQRKQGAGGALHSPSKRSARLDLLAGLLAGSSVAVAYNNAPVVCLLLVYRFYGPDRDRGTERFLVGLAAPAVVLMAYHWACFGDPLATPYRFQNPNFLNPEGKLFQWPSLHVLYEITVGPFRGLFYTSPVLALSLVGAVWMFSERSLRQEALLCGAVVVFYFVLNSSFIRWDGGWNAGPRYLIPCLPFMALFIHFLPSWARFIKVPLLLVSACFQTVITAVNPSPPYDVRNPLFDYCFSHFLHGRLSVNTQSVLALHLPAFEGKPDPPGAEWFSYNLGELVGLHGLWSLLPLLVLWVGAAWYIHRLTLSAET